MLEKTSCDGIAVGRGCLGKPWIFREIAAALASESPPAQPKFGEVADIMLEHAHLLVEHFGMHGGMLNFRKHAGWYTRAFPRSASLRRRLMGILDIDNLEKILKGIDREIPYPAAASGVRRGKRSGVQKVVLPPGFIQKP